VLGVTLTSWEMGSRLGLWSSVLLPGPASIGQALWALLTTQSLLPAIVDSMKMMLVGYLLAVALGIPLGVLIRQTPWLRQTLGPALMGLQTLPSVCWLPLALLWFGSSMKAVLFVVLGNSVFSIAVSTSGALSQVPPLMVQAGQTLGARGWTMIRRVLLPAAFPDIITGLRMGWTFAWRALMAGELIAPHAGLGRVLQGGRERGNIAEILATMLVIVLLGLLVETVFFTRIEQRVRRKWGLAQA
jgi:NitT/TauT family transport system permease protein